MRIRSSIPSLVRRSLGQDAVGRLGSSHKALSSRRHASSVTTDGPFRLAVIGSGPAGFYSSARVLARIPDATIDMFEKLPVPFGLVRYGVAPDHPEVKSCEDRFSEVAQSPQFRFVGNVEVGRDVSLKTLRENYDALLFAYGASQDRQLGIPGEDLQGVYSARAFVGWYNGLPEYADLQPKLDAGDTAVVVGQGNVALDVARILLSPLNGLRTTDITQFAWEALQRSTIRRVHVIGRRGPMQVAFTIKELRELLSLPDVGFRPLSPGLLPDTDVELPRAPKRLAQLLRKQQDEHWVSRPRSWSLDFLQSPIELSAQKPGNRQLGSITLAQNEFAPVTDALNHDAHVAPTGSTTKLDCSMAFRSIGYKSQALNGMADLGINFDDRRGILPNENGKILSDGGVLPGLYCTGWVKKGPTGVIASTMEDAFLTGEQIAVDWAGRSSTKPGWAAVKSSLPNSIDWSGWTRIDAAEKSLGKANGKPREKLPSIAKMLAIASQR